MPCHHMQHAQNVGLILFAHNENIAHMMPHAAACAVTSYVHRAVHTGKPAILITHGTPGITYGCAIHEGQTIFIKNNHLTF